MIKAHSFQEKCCSQERDRSLTRTTVCSWQNLSKIQFHVVLQSIQNSCLGRKKKNIKSKETYIHAVFNSNSFVHVKIIVIFFMYALQKCNTGKDGNIRSWWYASISPGQVYKVKRTLYKKITGTVWSDARVKKESRNWVKEKGRGSACTLLWLTQSLDVVLQSYYWTSVNGLRENAKKD